MSLYCSARNDDETFVTAYAHRLGEVKLGSTGVIRFRDAKALDLDGLRAMVSDLDAGLHSGRLQLRYGRTARTVASPDASSGPRS
jgi:hypothetical protein